MNNKMDKKRGQTLAEVMLVTFIIGVLAAVAVATINRQSHKSIKIWDYTAINNLTTVIDEINLEYKEKHYGDFKNNDVDPGFKEWGGLFTLIDASPNFNIDVIVKQVNVVDDKSSEVTSGASDLSEDVSIKNDNNSYSINSSGKRIVLPNAQVYYFGKSMFFVTDVESGGAYAGGNGMKESITQENINDGARGYKVIPIFIDVNGSSRGDNIYATNTNGGDIVPYLLFVDYITPLKEPSNDLVRNSFVLPYGNYADSDRVQIMVTRSDNENVSGTNKSLILNYRDAVCRTGGRLPNYNNTKLQSDIYASFCGEGNDKLAEENSFVYVLTFVPPMKGLQNIRGFNIN